MFKDKIEAIKFLRAFSDIGLREAKIVVEQWAEAYDFSLLETDLISPNALVTLGRMGKLVLNGTWGITDDSKLEVIQSKTVTLSDIRELAIH